MVGQTSEIKKIFDLIRSVAATSGTVLIQGASGTGKELVARALHDLSPRRGQPFVVMNCAAIPANLMESKIFGHYRGAFTGASYSQPGKLEIAHGGTFFLDDIDSLDIGMQAKLLRTIQEKEFERLGSTRVIRVDVRFLAASNKNLHDLIAAGIFREDLYYRLNVFPIELPPLCRRRSDIPLLLDHFLTINAARSGQPSKAFSERAVRMLVEYDWPGNVRELENLVERLFTIARTPRIQAHHLSGLALSTRKEKPTKLKDAVRHFEKRFIAKTLESAGGNKTQAARRLGIHRNTLLAKMNAFGLNL